MNNGAKGPKGDPGNNGAQGRTSPPGTTSFNGITDKPTWVDKFSYDDIGQYMEPQVPSNFDIVVNDSLSRPLPMLVSTSGKT
jgi:hypothetical protein